MPLTGSDAAAQTCFQLRHGPSTLLHVFDFSHHVDIA